MVGAFKVDEALPLLAPLRRLAAVDRQARPAGSRMSGCSSRQRVERARSRRGRSRRAQTVISFFADPPIEENEQTRVEAATEVLEIALRDILREELGETYGVSVGLSQALPQRGGGHIDDQFQRRARERREDDRPRAAGSRAAAEGRAVRGPDEPRQGDRAPRARDAREAERFLARPPAVREAARSRSAADPAAGCSASTRSRRPCSTRRSRSTFPRTATRS